VSAKILVVDDNYWVRETLPALLAAQGHEVDVATNGEDGFRRVCAQPYDVVLTDVSMPEVDGLELIRLMRLDPFFRKVPVIAMTAFGSQRAQQARDAGADACFVKPLDHGALLATIERLVRAARRPPH
jgi:CheY-like chemotaxis protein